MNTVDYNQVTLRPRFYYFKKVIQITTVLLVLVIAAPYALYLGPVKNLITAMVGSAVNGDLQIEGVSWTWLPESGIKLKGVRFSNAMMDAEISVISSYISVLELLAGNPEFTFGLVQPDIVVKTLKAESQHEKPAPEGKKISPKFPHVNLEVKKGHIRLPNDGFLQKLEGHDPSLEIFDMDASISATAEKVDIHTLCRLTFIENLDAHVSFEKLKTGAEGDDNLSTYWDLDISGTGVNLTEANEKVMLLFGENRTAKLVCGIVRGGRATSGGFQFEGFTADFNKFPKMTITAVAESAIIQVPGVDLHLEEARGPIKIENAVLTGENLAATLGNSYGQNCSINLGLAGKDRDFNLDIDLDADLSELPDLLRNNLLKKNQKIVIELANITSAKGRANAKLIIGDKLENMTTTVIVQDSDNQIDYKRLKYPVSFNQGTLEFTPERCTWNQVKGSIGPHLIRDSQGSLSWKRVFTLNIEKIDAEIHSGPLVSEIFSWPFLEEKLGPLLHSAEGAVLVKDFKVSGPINEWDSLEYNGDLFIHELSFDTPHLPGNAHIFDASVIIANNKIKLSGGKINLANQHLNVSMDLKHQNWHNFEGTVDLNGNIEENLGNWVNEKGWIPKAFHPAASCSIKQMTISLGRNEKKITGKLITPMADDGKISTTIDVSVKKNRIEIKDFTTDSHKEKASLTLLYDWTSDPYLNIDFKGHIDEKTLSSILKDNQLLSGNFSGDFHLIHFFNNPAKDQYEGELEISDYKIFAGDNRISIRKSSIEARASTIKMNDTLLGINDEEILINGRLNLAGESTETDLNVASIYLSVDNMMNVFHSLTDNKEADSNERPGESEQTSTRKTKFRFFAESIVPGNIDFDIKKLAYTPPPGQISQGEPLVWDDLTGSISLAPDSDMTVSVLTGSICGINTTGTWEKSTNTFNLNISSNKEDEIDLEKLFFCVEKENNYLTGVCNLDMAISGSPCHWKSGYIEFEATGGVIESKFHGFSKILTLINVSELFSLIKIKRIFSSGYPYSRLRLCGEIADNRLTLDEAFVVGDGLDFFSKGTADLCNKELDLFVYVKPLKMIDSLVTTIPFVNGKDLGDGKGSITVVPIKVEGQFRDPDVSLYKGKFLEGDKNYLRKIVNKTISLPSIVIDKVKPK